MSIERGFYSVTIDTIGFRKFYLTELSIAPANPEVSTREVLEKIEYVIKHQLPYDTKQKDPFANLEKADLYSHLNKLAQSVYNKYLEKQKPLNIFETFVNILKAVLSNELAMEKTCQSIQDRVATLCQFNSCFSEIPDEVIRIIINYLPIIALNRFESVNRHAKLLTLKTHLEKVQKFGYTKASETEAKKYYQSFLQQTAAASYIPDEPDCKREPLLPYAYIKIAEAYTKVSIEQADQIFSHVQNHLTSEEYCAMMCKSHACLWFANNNRLELKKGVVMLGEKLLPTAPNDEKTQQQKDDALSYAVKYNVFEIAQLFIKHMELSKERREFFLATAQNDEMKKLFHLD